MYGTHCKHCLLIPPLVSNNNLALLRCGYMCAGTLVHISRHLGKTSNNNNNKRCQLWIRYMFYHVYFHQVLYRISGLWPLLYYNCLLSALPLVFYSSLLLLSYHTMSIPCLISITIYLHALSCLCSRHDFQCMFMTQIYRYTCAYLCSPLGIYITTRQGVLSDSPCPGFGVWSLWILRFLIYKQSWNSRNAFHIIS